MLPSNSDVPHALALVTRREGHWDESIAYFDRALALDPRNAEFIMDAAATYAVLRQFPTALKLYDRVLDITPNDSNVMATKAGIYQAQGDLQEAARFLSEVNEQSPSGEAFNTKLTELRLQRNYGEAIRLLQLRQDQFHFASPHDKGFEQVWLALTQRLAGDTAGATATAEQARTTLEQLCKDQPQLLAVPPLSQAYAVMGEKDLALNVAEQAVALMPSAKDRLDGPGMEENLAFVQMIVGENSRAISILSQLLQRPYGSWFYAPAPILFAVIPRSRNFVRKSRNSFTRLLKRLY
jgi:tetratricopeptide (TPR) repeat protein